MRTTASISAIAALGLLALSTPAAHAAPASIKSVTRAGNAVTVTLKNPNRYKVSGSVSLISGQQLLAKRRTSVKKRRSTTVTLTVPSGAPAAQTVVSRLGRKGRKPSISRKAVKAAKSAPAAPAKASNLWTAASSDGGGFSLRVDGDKISMTEPIQMPVICSSTGEYTHTGQSLERFNPDQNWTIGNQDEVRQVDTYRVNPLVDSSTRRVSFTFATQRSGDTITGSLHQSFFHSQYNPFTYGMTYVNCEGTTPFTAHPTR